MLTEAFRWLKAVIGRVVKMINRRSCSLEDLVGVWKQRRPSVSSAANQFMSTLRRGSGYPSLDMMPTPTKKASKQASSWLPRGVEVEESDVGGVLVARGAQPPLTGRAAPRTIPKESGVLNSRDFSNFITEEMDNDFQTLRINVGGQVFLISKSALNRYPETVLGKLTARSPSFDHAKREFFFDRNPTVFESILDLYRINELHLPSNVCGKTALNELEFWGIPAVWVSACCWSHIHQVIKDEKLYQDLKGGAESSDVHATTSKYYGDSGRTGPLLNKLYDLRRSKGSRQVWDSIVMLLIFLSVCLFVADTNTEIKLEEYFHTYLAANVTGIDNPPKRVHYGIWVAEMVLLAILVVEFTMVLAATPRKQSFGFSSVFNLTYGLSLLGSCVGYWAETILSTPGNWVKASTPKTAYVFSRCVRWLRILRLLEILDWHSSLYVMWVATMKCHVELLLLFVVFFIQAMIYGAITFYLEREIGEHNSTEKVYRNTDRRRKFATDLPSSLYWAIITMTTVGYGDITPTTPYGRVVGAMCALSGVLVLALPVAILIESFQQYNLRHQIRQEKFDCQRGIFRSVSYSRNVVDVQSRASV